ncbi:ankyrin repeat-containing domain protein [Lentinula raphanica]|nr:ankyrin repeat-containing domain protein [Lentinula raphanica]
MSYQTEIQSYSSNQHAESTGSFNNANNFSIHGAIFNAAETINYTNHNYHSNDEEEKKEILKWLGAPDCFINLKTALNKRVTGTSQWILEDSAYLEWMKKAGIWWIQGKAGSGKTFLITYIIKNLKDTTFASSVVYHYFDTCDTTGSKTSYEGMLSFLMLQLGAQDDKIHPALKKLFQSSKDGLSYLEPTNIQLLNTLKEIIRDLFQQKHQVYIIIDALDECKESQHLYSVLEFIREMSHFSWLKIIISSRNHPPEALACFTTFLSGHNSIKEDIAIFVKNQMHLKFKNPSLEIEVRNKLLEKADGGNNIVRFAHASVKQFLLQSQEDNHNKKVFNLNAHLAHDIMTQMCLIYLLHYDNEYAIQNWAEHSYYNEKARVSSEDTMALAQKVLDTSSESFFKWKETYFYIDMWVERFSQNIHIFKDCNALHIVAFFDNLKSGRDVGTPLHVAAYMGHRDVVELLLKYDADINALSKDLSTQKLEETAIECAIHKGYKGIVEILLKHGAELNAQQTHLAFMKTGYNGHKEMLEFLLQCNAIKPQEHDLNTAFRLAAQEGHKDIVELLLENNVNVNAQNEQFETALKKAVEGDHKDIVELLFEKGATIDIQSSQFHILFEQAATYGHKKFIEISLNHCTNDINTLTEYLRKGFSYATDSGHEDIIEMLLEYNLKSEEKNTQKALLQAATFGHKDTVELLLLNNANVNAQGDYFGTALQAAAYGKHKAIIPLLLDHGADVNANEGYFGTALHSAVSYNQQDIILMLMINIKEHHFK